MGSPGPEFSRFLVIFRGFGRQSGVIAALGCVFGVTGAAHSWPAAWNGVAGSSESCRARMTNDVRAPMLKTFSLSILFFLALGLVVAAYATIPV
jgi:hypothetical protein